MPLTCEPPSQEASLCSGVGLHAAFPPGCRGCSTLWRAVMNYTLPLKLSTMAVISFNNFCKKEESLAKGRHWAGNQ